MAVTIMDVAREAGVSPSTVSYALSGKRTDLRIHPRPDRPRRSRRLGFTANAGARALATSQTMVIGLLTQFHQDEFAPAMLQYVLPVSDTARELGYDILLVTEADATAALRRVTSTGMVDGVVLLDVTHEDPRLETLRSAPQPGRAGRPAEGHRGPRRVRPRLRRVRPHPRRPPLRPRPPRDHRRLAAAARLRARRRLRLAVPGCGPRARSPLRTADAHVLRRVEAAGDRHQRQRHPGCATHRHRAHRPQRRHDRGAAVGARCSAGRGYPRTCPSSSLYSKDFGRAFSLPYTAIESSPDQLGQHRRSGNWCGGSRRPSSPEHR